MKKLLILILLFFAILSLNCKDRIKRNNEIELDIMGQIQQEDEFDFENQNPNMQDKEQINENGNIVVNDNEIPRLNIPEKD